ncbi:MAG: hypothetical protein A2X34_08170 [Elusimicrobia bacterium GWC2_51_8]|nr:MAG: hypothetical protein A2X33_11340 [Elusimicrobia bacterium GWA2_51_34]OGR65223.1 MAG: hypothetical protein A2X34_08170 [Elusimicrobia bacterium GWC2_51_8]OGR88129.1 MAG: hypothetical protein A2021_03025 [Elusimicrobia bacterium GWF2_52_66]HAF96428.1 hypothetical protein [Elusimicrobiota bacterium]HCE97264.1 hypothetical protein [Elusimicrobiota bacterium]
MKKYLFLALTLFCAGGLIAQVAQVPAAAGASKKSQSSTAAKKETAKTQDQDGEEGGVVIDSKSEDSEVDTTPYSSKNSVDQSENAGFASYLPAAYGPLKGVLNEQGRNVLVFENEDGILSFVQASVGKNSVSLKLLARVARSQE